MGILGVLGEGWKGGDGANEDGAGDIGTAIKHTRAHCRPFPKRGAAHTFSSDSLRNIQDISRLIQAA